MREQHSVAVDESLTFSDDAAEVQKLVAGGGLETVVPNGDYAMSGVSYPFAVPEVRVFIERIAEQYREANGSQLVVTSLTRPSSQQPRNAHDLSVHPAGMAVDFRVPRTAAERKWLESVLLELENAGVLDVTREHYPPHYHVAVFPIPYAAYLGRIMKEEAAMAPPAREPVFTARMTVAPAVNASAIGDPLTGGTVRHDLLIALTAFGGFAFAGMLARQALARNTIR